MGVRGRMAGLGVALVAVLAAALTEDGVVEGERVFRAAFGGGAGEESPGRSGELREGLGGFGGWQGFVVGVAVTFLSNQRLVYLPFI